MKRMTVDEALDVFSGMCMYAKSPTLDEAMNVIRKAVETGAHAQNKPSDDIRPDCDLCKYQKSIKCPYPRDSCGPCQRFCLA
jgi:hypothetical protein